MKVAKFIVLFGGIFSPCKIGGNIISNTTRLHEGVFRYHYDNQFTPDYFPCTYVAMIGVGTSMRVEEYNILATHMAEARSDLVVVITDHEAWNPLKTSAKKYAALVAAIMKDIHSLIPACKNVVYEPNAILGGHSVSGAVTLEALAFIDTFKPLGIFGLSPFRITDKTPTNDLPSLFWGFSEATCGVAVDYSADKAYGLCSPENGRALYQIQNPGGHPSHCIFADNGCLPVCPSPKAGDNNWVRAAVAESLDKFLHAIEMHNFTKAALQLSLPARSLEKRVELFVGDDGPMDRGRSFLRIS